ncbi:MAG: GTPase ObgE [Deltaproteobacteria bacterium]|nr:GTPase ObgE [Deltaproteobacteria bacterium]
MNDTKAPQDSSSVSNPSSEHRGPPKVPLLSLSTKNSSRRTPFVDEVVVQLISGSGGPGAVSFLREKFRPKGGPDGGDGGSGGSIYLVASPAFSTLQMFRYQRHLKAESGKSGGRNRRSGKSGEDLYVTVPVGTLVRNADTGEHLADLDHEGATLLIAEGGKGGKGNAHFVSSVRQAPAFAQPGIPGVSLTIDLELKLLANVGLIGAPNAGKSTLLAAISRAKPKIAPYPFTTLHPNLAVVDFEVGDSLVVADLPGLIEGAHVGAGLGTQFLRHIERTAVLVHLIDVHDATLLGKDISEVHDVIVNELRLFDPSLIDKPRLIALSKIDLVSNEEVEKIAGQLRQNLPIEIYPISSVTKKGLSFLVKAMREVVSISHELV